MLRTYSVYTVTCLLCVPLGLGFGGSPPSSVEPLADSRDTGSADWASTVPIAVLPEARSQESGHEADVPPIPREPVMQQLPDAASARTRTLEALEQAKQNQDQDRIQYHTSVLERIDSIRRPRSLKLTLEDVIRRTLANNYTIQTVSYNPAVETTRVVEAQAAFDAVFFGTLAKNKTDQPTANELFSSGSDVFNLDLGVRKLTPLGALVTGRYQMNRTKQTFAFQTLNPAYTSAFVFDLRQPLLRGFGLDFNRSTILITKNNRRISDLAFRRQVRDTLRQAEELYWRLVQARRDLVITAREVADFEAIYQYLLARKDFDILPVNIFASEADLELTRMDFVRRRSVVFDAEDRLTALMNDPEINLASGIELVPTGFPETQRIVVDPLAEVQAALDHRTEIKEQQLQVANAKISVGQARNNELPQADVSFTMTVRGLGPSADQSFDEATRNNFITYDVGVQLEVPIGNRSARAARRRAQLQQLQAASQLRRVLEDVILDVNLAVRQLETSYDQIPPNFASIQARARELESIVARAERKDYNTLTSELSAWRALAATRRAMLSALVDYNIAIVDLERAKGTLLEFDNVVIPGESEGSRGP